MLWRDALQFLLFDRVIYVQSIAPASTPRSGWNIGLESRQTAIIELVCLIAFSRAAHSHSGGICVTGYLVGVVASDVRLGNLLFTDGQFPEYVGLLPWARLYRRDGRVLSVSRVR